MNTLIRYAVIAIGAYAILILVTQWFERMNQYFPIGEMERPRPGMPPFEEFKVMTKDHEEIYGWHCVWNVDAPIVLLCHGNGGNLSHRQDQIAAIYRRNFNVVIFDYRGYGRSTGFSTEKGLYKDAQAVYDWLVVEKKYPPDRIAVIGTSLGGAVAVELALHNPMRALVLESTFTSKLEMAKAIMPFFPIGLFSYEQFNSLEKIDRVRIPVLIAHGTSDQIIPLRFGKALFEAAHEPKYFYPIKGADHNDYLFVGGSSYLDALEYFINRLEL